MISRSDGSDSDTVGSLLQNPVPDTWVPNKLATINNMAAGRKNNGERMALDVEFTSMTGSRDAQFLKDFPNYEDGLVVASPGGYVTLPEYPKKAEVVYNLKPRPDDVYVLTFPKCGITMDIEAT